MRLMYHWYHVYADGDWEIPVREHIQALNDGHLMDNLIGMHIGFVGQPDNVTNVRDVLCDLGVSYSTCAETIAGFEQETLDPLYSFAQSHDGFVLYTHTKGASRNNPIDTPWRRAMEYYNVVDWETPVAALETGMTIAGCHWVKGDPDIERLAEAWRNRELNPPGLDGVGGMFGGNFWWTRLETLRRNCRPGRESRFAAEHWLGQLSEVMPIYPDTICDLNPRPIVPPNLEVPWPREMAVSDH